MRLTSALFVSAQIRRAFSEGGAAAVIRHGADEAGAIFVIIDTLNGAGDLYGPAPQTAFVEDGRPRDRLFQKLMDQAPLADIDAKIAGETRFDPDIWVVSIEDRNGRCFLDLAED